MYREHIGLVRLVDRVVERMGHIVADLLCNELDVGPILGEIVGPSSNPKELRSLLLVELAECAVRSVIVRCCQVSRKILFGQHAKVLRLTGNLKAGVQYRKIQV